MNLQHVIACLILLIALAATVVYVGWMYTECRADGHAAYECAALAGGRGVILSKGNPQ